MDRWGDSLATLCVKNEDPKVHAEPFHPDMKVVEDFSGTPAYEILTPADQRLPFVFSSPHSGRCYPADFLLSSRLDHMALRRSEDAFVDELMASVVPLGAPLIKAHFPRAYTDVNREPYELDPKMLHGRLPSYANIRSVRVANGLGTIARIVSEGQEIYTHRLPVTEALERIEQLYKPFHSALRQLLQQTCRKFGFAVLIDCHSMPSTVHSYPEGPHPDFILGDRYGTSCPEGLSLAARMILERLGYNVCHNKPYAGGFITEHYGRPAQNIFAIQLEMNRGLYMDESLYLPHSGFAPLASDLDLFARELTSLPDEIFIDRPLAAE